ncbi:hypothetical protein [Rhizobium leguminosarum]|uniref:hypothetical protein n=1 Tax=Rhizobium leguminosarum TaxID=384 RepID=UPI002E11D8E4|nr:hypothetical protein U8Q02_10540 [Rhizobium leguminosarum]
MTATLGQIDQLIEAARRQLDGLVALRADMAGEPGSEVESFTDHDFAPCNLIELPLAAQRFEVSKDKLRRWCRDYGIGVLQGGRWRVSTPRLRRHLDQS